MCTLAETPNDKETTLLSQTTAVAHAGEKVVQKRVVLNAAYELFVTKLINSSGVLKNFTRGGNLISVLKN